MKSKTRKIRRVLELSEVPVDKVENVVAPVEEKVVIENDLAIPKPPVEKKVSIPLEKVNTKYEDTEKIKEGEKNLMSGEKARTIFRAFGDGFASVSTEPDIEKRRIMYYNLQLEVKEELVKLLEAVLVGMKTEFKADFGFMVHEYIKMSTGVSQ